MHHRTLDSAKHGCNSLGYPGVGPAQVEEPPRHLPVPQYPSVPQYLPMPQYPSVPQYPPVPQYPLVPRCLLVPQGPPVGAQGYMNQIHGMNRVQRVFPVIGGPYGYALVNQQPYLQGGMFPPQTGPSITRMDGWGGNMVGYHHAMVSRSRDFPAVLVLNWRLESLSAHATRKATL